MACIKDSVQNSYEVQDIREKSRGVYRPKRCDYNSQDDIVVRMERHIIIIIYLKCFYISMSIFTHHINTIKRGKVGCLIHRPAILSNVIAIATLYSMLGQWKSKASQYLKLPSTKRSFVSYIFMEEKQENNKIRPKYLSIDFSTLEIIREEIWRLSQFKKETKSQKSEMCIKKANVRFIFLKMYFSYACISLTVKIGICLSVHEFAYDKKRFVWETTI